jgi:hypothetical protein
VIRKAGCVIHIFFFFSKLFGQKVRFVIFSGRRRLLLITLVYCCASKIIDVLGEKIMQVKSISLLALLGLATSSFSAMAVQHDCSVDLVYAYSSRVLVHCANPDNGFDYFSVATSDAWHADRFLKTGTAALLSGKKVKLSYEPTDTGGEAFGCKVSSDCMKVTGFGLIK